MMRFSKLAKIAVAGALALSLAIQSAAAALPFTDLSDGTAKDNILALQDKGIINGIGNNLFAPGTTITAAQGITLIVKALDLNLDLIRFIKEPKATDYFKNADNDAWYANTLIIASASGLELPADLDPNAKWTKETFTNYLIIAMEKKANLPMIKLIPVTIADQADLTPDYDGAIQRALLYGVISLDADGKLNPKSELSRADAAVEIYNALHYLEVRQKPVTSPAEETPAA